MAWYPKIVTIKKDGTTGSVFPFPNGRCSVGGISSCDIQIRGAGSSHCLIIVDQQKQAHVVNVAGTPDVKRNGEDVANGSLLNHRDVVQIGSRQFRFEWVLKRKKGQQFSPVAASHQPQASKDGRESSTLQNGADNGAHLVQESNGTPGASTPTTYSFDQSLFKTPRIPPEMFVSPLSASDSAKEYNGAGSIQGADDLGNSRNSSTSSTPLIDEPRIRALRSRSSFAGMANRSLKQEQPASRDRQSRSPLKRRSQSLHTPAKEKSSKLRRSGSYGPARCSSLVCHSDANVQSGPSSLCSAEDSRDHIEAFAHPGLSAQSFAASTPVTRTRTARNGRLQSDRSLKSISFSHQENSCGFVTPGSQNCYPNGHATTDESFLDSPGVSKRALRSSQASLGTSEDTLGYEGLFKTPNHTDSVGDECGSSTTDVSNSSLDNKHTHKWLSHIGNENSPQGETKSVTAIPVSRRSRHSLEKSTNGTQTPSDQYTRSDRAKSSLGQNAQYTTSSSAVATAAETTDKLKDSCYEGHSDMSTLKGGVFSRKTGSKHTTSMGSTVSFKESPGNKSGLREISVRAARSSVTNREVASPTCSEDVSQDNLSVAADDSKRATRSTRFSRASNQSRNAESPEQEGAAAPEKGNEEESLLGQAVRDTLHSEQESLEHMVVVAESPRATVGKRSARTSAYKKVRTEAPEKEAVGMESPGSAKVQQTTKRSSQVLENIIDEPEKITLPSRSGRYSHTPTSKKVKEEVSDLETAGTPSSLESSKPRNSSEEMEQMAVSKSPAHVALDSVDVAAADEKASQAKQTSISQKEVEQKTFGTPRSLKALAARRVQRSSDVNEEEAVGTSHSRSISLQNRGVAHEKSFERSRRSRSSCTPTSRSVDIGARYLVEMDAQNPMRSSETEQVPMLRKNKTPSSEMLNTPKFSKALEGKETPSLIKEATGEDTVGTSPAKRTPVMGTGSVTNESFRKSARSRNTPVEKFNENVFEHDKEGTPHPLEAARASQSMSGTAKTATPHREVVGIPKFLKASGAKRSSTSKKVVEEQDVPKQTTRASQSKRVSFDDTSAVSEGLVRSRRSSFSSASRNGNMETSGLEEVCSQDPMQDSEVSKKSKEALVQEMLETPKSLKTSGRKQTSASSTIRADEEATEQGVMGTPPVECSPLMSNRPVGIERVGRRSTRSSHTPAMENSNCEAQEAETVGFTVNSLEASSPRKAVSKTVSSGTPQQEVADSPKSLNISAAKRSSPSKKVMEEQEDPKQTRASHSKRVSFDDTCGVSEGLVRPRRSSSSSASRNVKVETSGLEAVCSQGSMQDSGVLKESKEGLVQETSTPEPLKISGNKLTRSSAKFSAEEDPTEQGVMGTPSVECSPLMSNRHVGIEGVGRRSTRSSRAPAMENSNCEAQEAETVSFTLNSPEASSPRKAVSKTMNSVTPQQEVADSPKYLNTSTAKRSSPSKKVMEEQEVSKQTQASQSKLVSFDDTCGVSGNKQTPASGKFTAGKDATVQGYSPLVSNSPVVAESVRTRSTRSSHTPAVENSNDKVRDNETVSLTPSSLKATNSRKAVSRRLKNGTPQQEVADTAKSLSASAAKRALVTKNMEEELGQKTDASQSEPASSNDTCVANEESVKALVLDEAHLQETTGRSGAKRQAVSRKKKKAPEGKQVQVPNKENAVEAALEQDTVGTPSKAKLSPSSEMATAAEEISEISKYVALDSTDVTMPASGRVRRAARPKCEENLKTADMKTAGQEAECAESPLKASGAVQTLRELGEASTGGKLEAANTKKSRKVLQAKAAQSLKKANDEEEVPELASERALVEEPARPTRGCRTRGSRKDTVEAPEKKAADLTPSEKVTRAKRARGSGKVGKEIDEAHPNVAGSSPVMVTASQGKHVTVLPVENSPTKGVVVTRKIRGKRKIDLKEETEKHSTAQDVVVAKRGRRQRQVASTEDVPQHIEAEDSNYSEQTTNSKSTKPRRAAASAKKAQQGKAVAGDVKASPNIDKATVELASVTTLEPKRGRRKAAVVKVDIAQTAAEETPRKTRGRRAKALEAVPECADDNKCGQSRAAVMEQSEEVPAPKRTRKKM